MVVVTDSFDCKDRNWFDSALSWKWCRRLGGNASALYVAALHMLSGDLDSNSVNMSIMLDLTWALEIEGVV